DLLFTADWQGFVEGTAEPDKIGPVDLTNAGEPITDSGNLGGTCGTRPGLEHHLGTVLIVAVLLTMGLVAYTALQMAWKSIDHHKRLRQRSLGGDEDVST